MAPGVVLSPQQRPPAPRRVACLGVVLLFALSGCAAIQVRMGKKVYLAKTPVTSMTAWLPRGPSIAPGEKSDRKSTRLNSSHRL